MKKILSGLLILVLMSTMLIGCSSDKSTASQKSEEELKAEIKAEMEAEEKLKNELEAKIRAEMEAENKEKEDTKEENKETAPIVLSALMTKDEIISKLGDKYTFETNDDGGYFTYYSILKYDDISFSFYHDTEKLSADKHPDSIQINSNKYTFNYDFKIGDPALKAFEYCEKHFKKAYDHHNDGDIYDIHV